jgi:hypothetical protein
MSSINGGIFARRTRIRFNGIAFRAQQYDTRRVGAIEPVDPMTILMKMQISVRRSRE